METNDHARHEVCADTSRLENHSASNGNDLDKSHANNGIDNSENPEQDDELSACFHDERDILKEAETTDQNSNHNGKETSEESCVDLHGAERGSECLDESVTDSKCLLDEEFIDTGVNEDSDVDNSNVGSNIAESFCLLHVGSETVKLVTSLDLECVAEENITSLNKGSESLGKVGVTNTMQSSNSLKQEDANNKNNFRMDASVNHEHIGEHWVSRNLKTFEHLPYTNIDKLLLKSGCEDSVFHDLPDELIVKIFSYLTIKELCLKVALVCRKWRQISLDHCLWKNLDFSSCPNLSSLNMLWVMRRAPLLKRLVLCGRVNITRAEVAIFSECCPCIQDIDFGFCTNFTGDMIQCLAENSPELKKINIEGCDNLQKNCLKYIVKCKKLSYLNFSHCMFFDDSAVIYLAKGLPRIISINLDGICFLTDNAVTSLVSNHYMHLEEVELDGAEISDIGMQELARCQHLKHLGISFCECLTDKSLQYLKDLKNLVNLRLRKGSDFTAEGLSTFFKSASLSKLQVLNLSECSSINDQVVLDMSQACGRHLKELALSWCWFITDTGLVSIMDHCSNLETLDLLGIDRIFGECLSRVPEEMTKLKFLDLRQCNKILDNLIVDMVRRKKDLKVYNYYGEEFVHD